MKSDAPALAGELKVIRNHYCFSDCPCNDGCPDGCDECDNPICQCQVNLNEFINI